MASHHGRGNGGRDGAGSEHSLGPRERDILEFERKWWKHVGTKQTAIRERFGVSASRYYQLLGDLIDSDAALVHDPMLVKRLRRMRATRRRKRSARRLGVDSDG